MAKISVYYLKPAFRALIVFTIFLVGITIFLLKDNTATLSAPETYTAELEALGMVYAKYVRVTLTKVETTIEGKVSGDGIKWAERLEQVLAIGYAPGDGAFYAITFDELKDIMAVEMAGQRTPAEVVKAVMAPEHIVVRAIWQFARAEPVTSYAVFTLNGEPLFDTLLSMPAIHGPVFAPDHF